MTHQFQQGWSEVTRPHRPLRIEFNSFKDNEPYRSGVVDLHDDEHKTFWLGFQTWAAHNGVRIETKPAD